LAIAGLLLFWLPVVGLLLSLIAVFTAGGPHKKGRGLAAIGLVLSLLVTGGVAAGAYLVRDKFKNVTTIADPGCVAGKEVVLKNADLGGGTDANVVKAKLQVLIGGLGVAAKSARNVEVRAAMTGLSNDYRQLLASITANKGVPKDLETKIGTDANRIDELCTIGGAQK
jgi:hypothetical protein